MQEFFATLNAWAAWLNDLLWSQLVLWLLLFAGILFTVWGRFPQWTALTHGLDAIRGRFSDRRDPGAINHFQALATALSGTVGLGNIGGVAIAVALGGPGAVFWMWVVGFFGMALKSTEVTLAMLYRNTDDPQKPHGGPMFVAQKAFAALGRPRLGAVWGGVFCVTLLIATLGGGSMFQAWNVGALTQQYFGVPSVVTGLVLATLVALVIIGGIRRIGRVAGALVPFMCLLYLGGALYVLAVNYEQLPALFALIFKSAFAGSEAAGAFLGGTAGYAFLWGMKRAIYSNEAGQGSSPMAHSAAKTREPVREGVVAGLEPFIDTLIVCSATALVILVTGVWNRTPEARYETPPVVLAEGRLGTWSLATVEAPPRLDGEPWRDGDAVFLIVHAHHNPETGNNLHRLDGTVRIEAGRAVIEWGTLASPEQPDIVDAGVYLSYPAATLTALAFDRAHEGLGKWIVTAAVWLFALSTMISWSYYGEQGMVYLLGEKSVLPYQVIFCVLAVVANLGLLTTPRELDTLTTLGTGVMLWANIPLLLLFGHHAMRAWHDYLARLKAGEFQARRDVSLRDAFAGRDVE